MFALSQSSAFTSEHAMFTLSQSSANTKLYEWFQNGKTLHVSRTSKYIQALSGLGKVSHCDKLPLHVIFQTEDAGQNVATLKGSIKEKYLFMLSVIFSITHAVSCTVTVCFLVGQEEGLLC